jgi:Uma2 family endonuclease
MKSAADEYIPRYTYKDYLQWDGRWEIINGIAYSMTPSPSIAHQDISQRIAIRLSELLSGCRKCRSLLPVDWKIDDGTVVQPDNMVVCGNIKGKYLTGAPVIIFEITYPSTSFKDRNVKYKIYENQGVKYYIIVDPRKKSADVYTLKNRRYVTLCKSGTNKVTFDLCDCGIEFDFSRIW